MCLSEIDDLLLALVELLPFEDSASFALASVSTLRTLERANQLLCSSTFRGIALFGGRHFKGALFQQLQESLQAKRLVDVDWSARNRRQSSLSAPMPVALDTSGCFSIHFSVSASRALNGCPSVGIVDAAAGGLDTAGSSRHFPAQFFDDVSKPRRPPGPLGISCNPFTGKIHASHTGTLPKGMDVQLISERQFPDKIGLCQRSWTAEVVDWQPLDDETIGPDPVRIEIGMLISKGTLEFIRKGPDGWQRSGIVWDSLPEKVLCCAFLFHFVGQATVSVERISACSQWMRLAALNEVNAACSQGTQPVCTPVKDVPAHCSQWKQRVASGRVTSWTPWPPA